MIRIPFIFLVFSLLILPAAGAVSFSDHTELHSALGDTVTLTGTANHTTVVYLFMTGPRINPNGVSLTDIHALAEQGRMIRVPVSPDGDWEYIWYTGGISGRAAMVAGTYQIYASDTPLRAYALRECAACGYDIREVTFSIPPTRTPPVMKTGTLDIRAPVGLTIFIDGTPQGTTPAVLSGISEGKRIMELRSDSYYSWSEEVEVSEGILVVHPDPIAFPRTGSISVSSSPTGVLVYLNGAYTGKVTPAIVTGVSTGRQIIDLKPEGYHPWSRMITVYPGKTEVLSADLVQRGVPATPTPDPVPPVPEPGSLFIQSVPAGAYIVINDRFYGETPLFIDSLADGPHQVTLSKAGYHSWSGTVVVTAGETTNIVQSLYPLPSPTPSPSPLFPVFVATLFALVAVRRW